MAFISSVIENTRNTIQNASKGMKTAGVVMLALAFAGCESAMYYTQAVHGQWEILEKREPIDDLLDQEELDPDLRQKLELVESVRVFAAEELSLPVGGAYSSYSDVERQFVVWNVFAAPEFSVTPTTWCFPIAGCIAYRGYFSPDEAVKKAKSLKEEGLDVHVGGVRAYSTLGWFDDPVLNTFIYDNDLKLVSLLIHEIAHRQLYVKGDTGFNESFASAVEQEGTRRWLMQQGLSASEADEQVRGFQANREKRAQINARVLESRGELEVLYGQPLSQEAMREQKKQILAALNDEYLALKALNGWDDSYDNWIASMNNAKMGAVSSYRTFVPAFTVLLEQHGGDFEAFYESAKALSELPIEERTARLQSLMATPASGDADQVPQ